MASAQKLCAQTNPHITTLLCGPTAPRSPAGAAVMRGKEDGGGGMGAGRGRLRREESGGEKAPEAERRVMFSHKHKEWCYQWPQKRCCSSTVVVFPAVMHDASVTIA